MLNSEIEAEKSRRSFIEFACLCGASEENAARLWDLAFAAGQLVGAEKTYQLAMRNLASMPLGWPKGIEA